MNESLTPSAIVEQLDKHIVGQARCKKMVAIAIRNRLRRRRLAREIARDIVPKNIMMIGPTGVGKTEIARRLAQLVKAPFVKVEATKYTEVGYVGRDVDSMIRDLVETAVAMVREEKTRALEERVADSAEERVLDLLLPPPPGVNGHAMRAGSSVFPERRAATPPARPASTPPSEIRGPDFVMRPTGESGDEAAGAGGEDDAAGEPQDVASRWRRSREKLRGRLRRGELDARVVKVDVAYAPSVGLVGGQGMEEMGIDMRGMIDRLMPRQTRSREMPVKDAVEYLKKEAAEEFVDSEEVAREALERAAEDGIVFIDEFDKIAGRRGADGGRGPDVSREGVQRDILPIVEGSSVVTKYGIVRTDHVLFIAAGAFSVTKPSDLIPELQGRFPLRCELEPLTRDDFKRILVEPENSLTQQYRHLLSTDQVELEFTGDGIDALAEAAAETNERMENIGARRLHTILERVLEDVSFKAPEHITGTVTVDAAFVRAVVNDLMRDEDLQKYIL